MTRIEKIAIVSHEEILYVNVYDVVYLESQKETVVIHFIEGRSATVNKQLSKLQELLPSFFVRITQCVIINKLYLASIDKKEKLIKMEGNHAIAYTLALGKLIERIGRISTAELGKLTRLKNDEDGSEALLEIA